jgi:hypothetical protein
MLPVRASGHRRRDAKNPRAGILGVMPTTDDVLEQARCYEEVGASSSDSPCIVDEFARKNKIGNRPPVLHRLITTEEGGIG